MGGTKVRRPKSETRHVINALEKAVIVLDSHFVISFVNNSALQLLDLFKHRTYNGVSFAELLDENGWVLESDRILSTKLLSEALTSNQTITICKQVGRFEKKYKTLKLSPFQSSRLKGSICEITRTSEVREELRSQQTFIRMIGHEAKQPLSIMKAYLYRLKKSQKEEEKLELLQHLNYQVDNIANMLTELAESLKMKNKRFEVVKEKTKIREVFLLTTREITDLYPTQRFRFRMKGCTDGTTIELDKIRFSQVLRNIISNAVKYGTPNKMIYVTGTYKNEGLVLKFSNYGENIPKETLLTIFDPYVRNHSASEKKGIGLGLYIVREIIRQHGGTIKAESKNGKTTFTVFFPKH